MVGILDQAQTTQEVPQEAGITPEKWHADIQNQGYGALAAIALQVGNCNAATAGEANNGQITWVAPIGTAVNAEANVRQMGAHLTIRKAAFTNDPALRDVQSIHLEAAPIGSPKPAFSFIAEVALGKLPGIPNKPDPGYELAKMAIATFSNEEAPFGIVYVYTYAPTESRHGKIDPRIYIAYPAEVTYEAGLLKACMRRATLTAGQIGHHA